MVSTPRSFRSRFARDSVLASRGKNLAEYGSSLSSTTLSRSRADSTCRSSRSGSLGSGLVATAAQKFITSDLVCHDWNRTSSLNDRHASGSIVLFPAGRICLAAVEDGSKPASAGVTNAFKFWVIESSIVDRDFRRKSVQCHLISHAHCNALDPRSSQLTSEYSFIETKPRRQCRLHRRLGHDRSLDMGGFLLLRTRIFLRPKPTEH